MTLNPQVESFLSFNADNERTSFFLANKSKLHASTVNQDNLFNMQDMEAAADQHVGGQDHHDLFEHLGAGNDQEDILENVFNQ